jgi:hypothetical protein
VKANVGLVLRNVSKNGQTISKNGETGMATTLWLPDFVFWSFLGFYLNFFGGEKVF